MGNIDESNEFEYVTYSKH